MCKCGCNTCETKGPLLTEGKVKSLLSEGLQYHIDKKIPLFETVHNIGSDKYLALIKEARKMYSRNIIDLCEDDEVLIKTDLGEFGLYEGVSVPLDLPMLNETKYRVEYTTQDGEKAKSQLYNSEEDADKKEKQLVDSGIRKAKVVKVEESLNEIDEDDEYEIASRKLFDMTWDEVRRQNDQDMVQDVHDEVSKDDEEDWDDDDNMYTLRESYDYDEVAQSEFGMDYDQLGSGEKEWVRDEIDNMSMKESDSNYPDFDLNKNIRYQEGSISSGMWRYTGQEQGGKGVYRNLNNGQILGFDRSDFDIFRKNLSSHFDFTLNEAKFKGKTVDLNKPTRGDSKKFKVYVNSGKKNADGSIKVKKVNFGHGGTSAKKAGQKTMSIRQSNPKARKAFRARHNCSNPGPKTMARYWSCKKW